MSTIIVQLITIPDTPEALSYAERVAIITDWMEQRESLVASAARRGSSAAVRVQQLVADLTIPPTPEEIADLEQAMKAFEQVVL